MNQIQILSSDVVNQIAAGEVVERPAHMIKELVENSIDAGATELEIEFNQGGRWVRVVDNGFGMNKEDLPLAFERHATSKIHKASDLWSLHTFGFRGEALASISAVSRMTITSRTEDQAYQVVSEFGRRQDLVPVGGDRGTSMVVEELFSNVPARLKFLKSDVAESTQIKNVLRALALANPSVSFRILSKGQLLFYWPAVENLVARAQQILEQKEMFLGEGEYQGVKCTAAFCSPNITSRTSRSLWTLVQNRWVQDRSLQASVMEAYRSLLMHGEYPFVVLWLECPPEDIDVNIHPTKSQVKFRDPKVAFRAVQAALRPALEKAPWLSQLIEKREQGGSPVSHYQRQKPSPSQGSSMGGGGTLNFNSGEFQRTQYLKKEFQVGSTMETLKRVAPPEIHFPPTSELIKKEESISEEGVSSQKQKEFWSLIQVLGQANQTYIVGQTEKGLIFVDQHAAHERVVYEKLMSAWSGGAIEIQESLFPNALTLSAEQARTLWEAREELQKLGVTLEEMGAGEIGVRAAPALLKESSLKKALEILVEEMAQKGGSFAVEKAIGHVCATLACHSVVRAGQALSQEQMESLLQQMDEFPLSSFCPHGRPVFVEYPFQKMERDFGRTV